MVSENDVWISMEEERDVLGRGDRQGKKQGQGQAAGSR